VGGATLVADMSSNFMSRPVDVAKFGVIYAGAQKNVGPAGVTIAIVREDLMGASRAITPTMLDWKTAAENDSMCAARRRCCCCSFAICPAAGALRAGRAERGGAAGAQGGGGALPLAPLTPQTPAPPPAAAATRRRYNTPPCWTIYMCGLVFDKLLREGGLGVMHAANKKKAGVLYEAIAASNGFYNSPVAPAVRSLMNVPFTIPSNAELEKAFVKEAEAAGMIQLKGHRSVGGMRASIYNAMPLEGVQQLAAFMKAFHAKHA